MDGDGGFESSGYLREYARGNVDGDPDVHVHAGLVRDDRARRWLSWLADHYQPATDEMPASFWETRFAREALRQYGTETAQRAVEEGQMHVIDFLTGMPSAQADISVLETIEWLEDWVTRTAAITLLSGHMGTGKTDFALLLAAIWQRQTGGSVLSNIRTCPQTESVSRMSKLKERVMESKDEPVLFVFDEAAAHASSDLDDHETKEQMRQLIRFLRKYNSDVIVIGHQSGGKDLNTEFRRLGEAAHKTSKKKAEVYGNIEGREYTDKKRTITGIPSVSDYAGWDFDTTETSSWMWDLDDEELELTDIDEVDVPGDEEVEEDDEYVCGAETENGEPCQMKVAEPGEKCRHHR
ncbi:AAA family ATPase [Haloferax volcanii]|uniref:AAA+ ATPase domain-containing protein n=2 Tax=Haloferax volcanii TaxID=2246 RepID=M0ICI4_HALVO|nr:AAA family ATPase [Haloferax alexandrinus]ELZ93548.1 hypothetical protein C452_04988 [Haloferax alexandrinus JCM 10717]